MIRNAVLVLLLMLLPTAALAIPVTSLDRMCNIDLYSTSVGTVGYSDGMCITSATSDIGEHDDIACWYNGQNNMIYTTWIGGETDVGTSPLLPSSAYGSCDDFTSFGDNIMHIRLKTDDYNQVPSVVFDAGVMPYLGTDEPASCNCACPIPDYRDGIFVQGDWTLNNAFNNRSENRTIYVDGSMGPDAVWAPRNKMASTVQPAIRFHGEGGNDTFVTYGRMLTGATIHAISDGFFDYSWWVGFPRSGGNDTVWAGSQEQAGSSMYSSVTDLDMGDGDDYFWLNDFTNRVPGTTWEMGAGGTDRTTVHGAGLTVNEDSQVALPAMPACPAWIQGGVTNGGYPGMQ